MYLHYLHRARWYLVNTVVSHKHTYSDCFYKCSAMLSTKKVHKQGDNFLKNTFFLFILDSILDCDKLEQYSFR